MDFPEMFVAFRETLRDGQDKAFISHENIQVAGRTAALKSSYGLTSERRMLGLIPMGTGHAHEHRLLFAAPELDADSLFDWWNYSINALDELVEIDDTHEFTILSLILACDKIDPQVVKKMKRLSYEKNLSEGWISMRAIAVELGSRNIYASRTGGPLREIVRASVNHVKKS